MSSAVPPQQPVQVEEEKPSFGSRVKAACCKRNLPCCCMWTWSIIIALLVGLVTYLFVFLGAQANNPPPIVTRAPDDAKLTSKVNIELGFGNTAGLDTFLDEMENEDSTMYSAMKDACNGLLDSALEVDKFEAKSQRRRLAVSDDGRVDVAVAVTPKENADGGDALNELTGEINGASSEQNNWKETVAAAAESALAAAYGVNATVTGEGVGAVVDNIFFYCVLEEPFENKECGGALNTALRQSQEVADAIRQFSEDCFFHPDSFPIAYSGCLDEVLISATCDAKVGQYDFLCRLEDAMDKEVGRLRGFAEQYGLNNCAASGKVTCWTDPLISQTSGTSGGTSCDYILNRCRSCGTKTVGSDDKIVCRTRQTGVEKTDFCPWASGNACSGGEDPTPTIYLINEDDSSSGGLFGDEQSEEDNAYALGVAVAAAGGTLAVVAAGFSMCRAGAEGSEGNGCINTGADPGDAGTTGGMNVLVENEFARTDEGRAIALGGILLGAGAGAAIGVGGASAGAAAGGAVTKKFAVKGAIAVPKYI